MKKNFLLLMLMVLLPLAGWAQTSLSGYAITFGSSDQEYAYYSETSGAADDKRPTIKLTKTSSEDITEASGSINVVWKDADGNTVTELKTVGVYTVTVTADNSATYGELTTPSRSFWVLKANNSYSPTGVVVSTAQTYAAAGYDLLTTTPAATFGTVNYMVKLNDTTVPDADAEGWSTTAPHATKVGAHSVFIKVDGTDNYKAIAPSLLGTVTINGTALVANTDYTAPTALSAAIAFDNTAHALANAGAALTDKCTMWYKLGDDGEWQENVPTATDVKTGSYTVYWKAEGVEGYADATGSVSATISIAAPTVTAGTAADLTYTGVDQALLSAAGTATIGAVPTYSIKYSATETSDWSSLTPTEVPFAEATGKAAGYYQVTTQVKTAGNYAEASAAPIVVQIKKATLTVTADAMSKVYGATDPTLTATYTGFVNSETSSTAAGFSVATWTRATGENAGEYVITKTADATADNYQFTYDEDNYGKFTITQKELNETDFTFTLADASKTYTGEAVTTTIATAKFGSTDLTDPADYTYVASNNVNVGTANVIISGQGNFKGSVVKTFTITAQPVYIKPLAASKNYGDDDPDYEYALVSAPAGAVVSAAELKGTVTLARVEGENVGTYKIYVKSYTAADDENYKIADDQIVNNPTSAEAKNVTATFTINATGDGLVLKFKDDLAAAKKTKVYGDANPTWSIDDLEYVSGAIGDDDWAAIKPTLSAPTFALSSEEVDDNNQITVSGLASTNYPSVTVQPLDFTVTARPITVTLAAQSIAYGGTLGQANSTNWNITTGSLASSDNTDDLNLVVKTVNDQSTYAVSSTAYEEAITAEIDNNNYELSVVKGALTVTSGTSITLTNSGDMDALIKAYGGQNVSVTLDRNIARTEAWFAMVLPFETTVTELATKFGYCVVNVLDESNTDASKVKFKLAFGTINANQPFLVKLGTAIAAPVDFGTKDVVYDEAPVSEDAAGNKYHGVFKSTALEASSKLWVMVPADDKFKKLDEEGTTLNPINAYLETVEELDAFAPTIFVEDIDGSVTAINAAKTDAETINGEGWYNLNGVKLEGVPTEKGIYIKNGKKVVIK